jgi:hypothetical protein
LYAERLIVETDAQGYLSDLPKLPPNAKVEVIMLILEENTPLRRQPHPSIAGQGKILGDIISPAVPEEDWDVLR